MLPETLSALEIEHFFTLDESELASIRERPGSAEHPGGAVSPGGDRAFAADGDPDLEYLAAPRSAIQVRT